MSNMQLLHRLAILQGGIGRQWDFFVTTSSSSSQPRTLHRQLSISQIHAPSLPSLPAHHFRPGFSGLPNSGHLLRRYL